jgi:hypothetical protein
MSNDPTEDVLSKHRVALNAYNEWDEKVKQLLRGRRHSDLTPEDMEGYREASEKRDAAYDEMRHWERLLLDNIPGASTGSYAAIRREDLDD